MTPWLTVIGIGEEGYAGLGEPARQALASARLIIGAPRQLRLLPAGLPAEQLAWPSPFSLAPVLSRRGQPLCMLASGDPMLFGAGASLARQLPAEEMQVLPAPSCCALAAARLGWPLQAVQVLSVVGRPLASLNRALYPGARWLVLVGDGRVAARIAAQLCAQGFSASRLVALEHLGGPLERRLEGIAGRWSVAETADLCLLAVECQPDPETRPLPPGAGLPDEAYRHDGQLTKQDVRAISLARLAPLPGQLLWDVGAGCGSIGIEWLRSHPECRAIAIESHARRLELIRHNSETLGVPQLQRVTGRAPDALQGLERPEAIFIGGGLTCPGLLDCCWQQLRPSGRLVANAVTLQGEARLVDWQARHGGTLTRISLSRTRPLGQFSTWQAALPIVLLECHKPGDEA